MPRAFAEIAFTPSVRAVQARQGSAAAYERLLDGDAVTGDRIGPEEAAFIAARQGFYQASVSETGWPYVQFRGGPRGFLRVLDSRTVAYADYRGNRQYLSAGNIAADGRVSLILMDYAARRRLKLWGRARISEDPEIAAALHPPGYRARSERAVIVSVAALDWNCPQHIPRLVPLAEAEAARAALEERIAALEAENRALAAGAGTAR